MHPVTMHPVTTFSFDVFSAIESLENIHSWTLSDQQATVVGPLLTVDYTWRRSTCLGKMFATEFQAEVGPYIRDN